MNEFENIKRILQRVGTQCSCYDYARTKSIYIAAGDGELELEFDENGILVDTTYWRD